MLLVHVFVGLRGVKLTYTFLTFRIHLRSRQQNGARRWSGGRGQLFGGGTRGEEKEDWGGAEGIVAESYSSTDLTAADGERESKTTR